MSSGLVQSLQQSRAVLVQGAGSITGGGGERKALGQLLHRADCSGVLTWEAWERMHHRVGSGYWVQELETVVTWTGTIAASRTEWIHKAGGCGPVCGRKMETQRAALEGATTLVLMLTAGCPSYLRLSGWSSSLGTLRDRMI